MNSRIDTLLSTFDLQERKWIPNHTQNMGNIDYAKVFSILEKEKNKEKEWIKQALNSSSK